MAGSMAAGRQWMRATPWSKSRERDSGLSMGIWNLKAHPSDMLPLAMPLLLIFSNTTTPGDWTLIYMSLWVCSSVAKFKPCFAASMAHTLFTITHSELKDSQINLVERVEVQNWNSQWARYRDTKPQRELNTGMFGIGSPEKSLHPEQRGGESLSDRVAGHLKTSAQKHAHAGTSNRCSPVGRLPHRAVQISAGRRTGLFFAGPEGIIHTCAPSPTRQIPPRWVHAQSGSTAVHVLT